MSQTDRLSVTKGNNSTELAPSPYFSIKNVHLVDINVFAKFDEIRSLPFQDIKERPIGRGQKDRRTYVKIVYPPTPHKQFAGGIIMVRSRRLVNLTTLFLGRLSKWSISQY